MGTGDRKLEEALGALMGALDDYRGQFPELQGLEQEVTRLESLLMVRAGPAGAALGGQVTRLQLQLRCPALPQQRQGLTRSRASSLSITVEHALESFSFLHEDEDEDNDGAGDR